MNERERMQEQIRFDIANNWLEENGTLRVFPFKNLPKCKIEFTRNEILTTVIGEDMVRLTIQLYYEVKD